jgi:predicted oxidoreductase
MALKINQNRTFKAPVNVNYFDTNGNQISGNFMGVFRVLKMTDFDNKETKFIDTVLVGVEGIDMSDDFGNAITGDALLVAVKNDTDLASACVEAFNAAIEKKRTSQTSVKPSAT